MPTVLISRLFPEPVMAEMARRFTLLGASQDSPASRAMLLELVLQADALAVTLAEAVDAELLSLAHRLKVVAVYAVGYDNVDVTAATARGIVVTNTPDVLTEATADLTWGLMLTVARRIPEGERLVREGRWTGWAPTQLLGWDLWGKTLGVIGMGRIGRAVARRAAGFGMPVLYHNRRALDRDTEKALQASPVPLPQLLSMSDFVTIHLPLTNETRHLIGKAELARMKETAFLINTARGAIVDEAALTEALAQSRLKGAALDVYEHEPRIHPGLKDLPNVVLLPHMGSATHETRVKMGMMMVENISAVLAGKEPPNRVR
jgi:glyoxylate reductase